MSIATAIPSSNATNNKTNTPFLIALDFDGTLTGSDNDKKPKNTHNMMKQYARVHGFQNINIDDAWDWLKEQCFNDMESGILAVKYGRFIKNILTSGGHIAIVSFNNFPWIIKKYLKKMCLLNDEDVDKIFISSKTPEDPEKADKNLQINELIERIKTEHSSNIQSAAVILIDDSEKNIKSASLAGYSVIKVESSNNNPDKLWQTTTELLSRHNVLDQQSSSTSSTSSSSSFSNSSSNSASVQTTDNTVYNRNDSNTNNMPNQIKVLQSIEPLQSNTNTSSNQPNSSSSSSSSSSISAQPAKPSNSIISAKLENLKTQCTLGNLNQLVEEFLKTPEIAYDFLVYAAEQIDSTCEDLPKDWHTLNDIPRPKNKIHVYMHDQSKQKLAVIPEIPNGKARIVGDLHGQFPALCEILRKDLYRFISGSRIYIGLGDYIDRGKQSLESFFTLLVLKIIAPDSFALLRGNHETGAICLYYGFFAEIQERFSSTPDKVTNILTAAVKLFDQLPLLAVLSTPNKKILALHGGLPVNTSSIYEWLSENQISNILWSDCTLEDLTQDPAPNDKRGNGIKYGIKATNVFCETFECSFIFRGHEIIKCITDAQNQASRFGGRIVTVSSTGPKNIIQKYNLRDDGYYARPNSKGVRQVEEPYTILLNNDDSFTYERIFKTPMQQIHSFSLTNTDETQSSPVSSNSKNNNDSDDSIPIPKELHGLPRYADTTKMIQEAMQELPSPIVSVSVAHKQQSSSASSSNNSSFLSQNNSTSNNSSSSSSNPLHLIPHTTAEQSNKTEIKYKSSDLDTVFVIDNRETSKELSKNIKSFCKLDRFIIYKQEESIDNFLYCFGDQKDALTFSQNSYLFPNVRPPIIQITGQANTEFHYCIHISDSAYKRHYNYIEHDSNLKSISTDTNLSNQTPVTVILPPESSSSSSSSTSDQNKKTM